MKDYGSGTFSKVGYLKPHCVSKLDIVILLHLIPILLEL